MSEDSTPSAAADPETSGGAPVAPRVEPGQAGRSFGEVLEQFIEHLVIDVGEGERHRETQRTKQLEIEAGVQRKAISSVFWIVAMILALGGIALFRGSPEIAKEMVVALISGAGGFGLGRWSAKTAEVP